MDIQAELARLWRLKAAADQAAEVSKAANQELEKHKLSVLTWLKETGLDSVKSPEGTVYKQCRFSVTVPKGDNKAAFFEYLRQRGCLEEMTTVNSQTLNSWYKRELELAGERGELDFKIPGIGEPSANEFIAMKGT